MPSRSSPTTSKALRSSAHCAARATSAGRVAVISSFACAIPVLLGAALDVHLDLDLDLLVQPHGDLERAETLERLLEHDLPAVDLEVEAALLVGAVRDVRVGDGAEQLGVVPLAGARVEHQHQALDLGRAAARLEEVAL